MKWQGMMIGVSLLLVGNLAFADTVTIQQSHNPFTVMMWNQILPRQQPSQDSVAIHQFLQQQQQAKEAEARKAALEKIGPKGDFSRKNLPGWDFSNADVVGANFFHTDLSGANFSNANAQGANFSQAKLTGADFTGANLQGANFSQAIMDGVDIRGANLNGAKGIQ